MESELRLMAKRLFDLVVAYVGLILLTPVFLIVALLIMLDSRGPILYRGQRIGKDGAPFKMFKFRTMAANADRMGSALTRGRDPRVTRVGRILRKWKIDEFPQLLNVLRGEMSVVGPRPESPCYVEHYTPEQRRVLQVKPGLTGLWQVMGRSRLTYKQRRRLDLFYVHHRSVGLYLKILARTVRPVLSGNGSW